MKKLSLLFLLPILFFSCSSDDNEPSQDYTSFVFMQPYVNVNPNVVIAYKTTENIYIKVAILGDLKKGEYSKEIRVEDDNIKELYFFSDYVSDVSKGEANRLDHIFKLTKNIKNIFVPEEKTKGIIVDRNNPKQYPQ